MKGRDHPENLGVDGNLILERILEKTGWEYVDWVHLAKDRDQWRAVVNTVMNLRIKKNGNYLIRCATISF